MLTKKIANFSDDLLNTVRGILGEAKKCPVDCECPKCEAENGMKEGYVPTNDMPTDKDRNTAAKVAELLKRERAAKKLAKEDVDLDEGLMHDRYMRSHGKKARGAGSWAFTTKQYGSPKEKEMHFTSGHKSLSDAHKEAAAKLGTKHLYVMEEVEQIDELSKKTLGNYINKANKDSVSRGIEYGFSRDKKDSLSALEKLPNRTKGIKRATDKLTKEEQDFVDSLNDADIGQIDELSKKTLGSYVKRAADQKDKLKRDAEAASQLGHDMRKLDNNEAGAQKMFQHAGKQIRKSVNRTIGLNKAVDKLTKEEVEQIDELSKKTLGSYIKKASGAEKPKNVMSPKNIPLTKIAAYQGDSETGPWGNRFNQAGYDKADRLRKNRETGIKRAADKLAKEETEITEARGRPKKAGAKDFTIHPKTKEKMMHNNPEHMKRIERLQKNGILEKPKVEAGQHIMNQLSKAKTSMLGGSKINFTHGDSKHVSGTHAAKILTKYAGMKPSEKEDFQKFVGHSHENLMKHV